MKKSIIILLTIFSTLFSFTTCFAGALGNFNCSTVSGGITNQGIFAKADLTMVNVWATFCQPCIEEIPGLQKLSESYKGKGVQIVGIVADTADAKGRTNGTELAAAKKIIANANVTYTNIIPVPSMYSNILGRVVAVPTTFFLDKNGNQVGTLYLGSKSEAEWAKIIETVRSTQK